MKRLTTALAVLILLGVVAAPVLSTTFRVPSQHLNIQAGLDAAGHGDTVLVADGTYAGDGNRDLDFHGTDLILRSEHGPEVTIVDCGGSLEEPHRAINLHSSETLAAVVDGFTFQNGHLNLYTAPDGWGGAIVCEASSPMIRDCHFLDNQVLAAIVPPGACGGAIAVGYSHPRSMLMPPA